MTVVPVQWRTPDTDCVRATAVADFGPTRRKRERDRARSLRTKNKSPCFGRGTFYVPRITRLRIDRYRTFGGGGFLLATKYGLENADTRSRFLNVCCDSVELAKRAHSTTLFPVHTRNERIYRRISVYF